MMAQNQNTDLISSRSEVLNTSQPLITMRVSCPFSQTPTSYSHTLPKTKTTTTTFSALTYLVLMMKLSKIHRQKPSIENLRACNLSPRSAVHNLYSDHPCQSHTLPLDNA